MSDALLKEIVEGIKGLRTDLNKVLAAAPAATAGARNPTANAGGATTGGAGKPAADKAAADAAKKATATADAKKAAEKAAADKAAAEKPKGPPAGTKAPGGKHTVEQVREIIRKVAADASLGRQSAKDILADDGGGAESVLTLKPEFYDAVYEACNVLLSGEGAKDGAAAADEDDLM